MTETVSETFTDPVSSVVVTSDAGSLTSRPGKPTEVVAEKHWLVQEPEVTMEVTDEILRVDVTCPDVLLIGIGDCWADLTLTVPERVSVRAELTAGSIDVASLIGDETLSTGAGRIGVTDVVADSLQTDTSSGSIRLANVETEMIEADTGSGSIAMGSVTARKLLADSSSGSIRLAKVEVAIIEADTGSGESRSTM